MEACQKALLGTFGIFTTGKDEFKYSTTFANKLSQFIIALFKEILGNRYTVRKHIDYYTEATKSIAMR